MISHDAFDESLKYLEKMLYNALPNKHKIANVEIGLFFSILKLLLIKCLVNYI